jgi:hypothetical protein
VCAEASAVSTAPWGRYSAPAGCRSCGGATSCWCRGSDAASGSRRGIRSFHHLPCRHHAPACAGTPLLPLLRGGSVMVLLRMTCPPGLSTYRAIFVPVRVGPAVARAWLGRPRERGHGARRRGRPGKAMAASVLRQMSLVQVPCRSTFRNCGAIISGATAVIRMRCLLGSVLCEQPPTLNGIRRGGLMACCS